MQSELSSDDASAVVAPRTHSTVPASATPGICTTTPPTLRSPVIILRPSFSIWLCIYYDSLSHSPAYLSPLGILDSCSNRTLPPHHPRTLIPKERSRPAPPGSGQLVLECILVAVAVPVAVALLPLLLPAPRSSPGITLFGY